MLTPARRAVFVAALAACVSPPAPAPSVLPLGEVTGAASTPCPAGAPPGAACTSVVVACPGLDDLGATLAVTEPAAPAQATVYLHDNLGGTLFFDYGFAATYLSQGLRVVQVQWRSDWETSSAGLKAATCRYATLLSYAFKDVHGADRTHGFCAQSYGGGSGGLAMSLAHFGADDWLDAVTVSAGPPFARIDLGCDPTSSPVAACAAIPLVPVAYSDGPLTYISGWEAAPTCGTTGAPASEVARWAGDSILSPGAVLAYPQTSLAAWYCSIAPDATDGQGSLYFDAVTTEATVHCVSGGAGGGMCSGQPPWPSGLPDMAADLVARCIPRH